MCTSLKVIEFHCSPTDSISLLLCCLHCSQGSLFITVVCTFPEVAADAETEGAEVSLARLSPV